MDRKALGNIGEKTAEHLLRSKGYEILEENYRCPRGEIDIIARKDDVICFVEVKTRQNMNFGRPCEAITREKQYHMRRAADHYIEKRQEEGGRGLALRFQVIEILINHMDWEM